MNIGILTLPLHTNYGGLLQAYALQTTLQRLGHNAVVLDTPKKKRISGWDYPLTIIKRCINSFFFHKGNKIFYEQWYNKTYPIISKHTQLFINRNIHRFEILNLQQIPKEMYDAFLVGSDQVWRPVYFTSMYNTKMVHAYLGFTKGWNVKRIAYAASFGTDKWEYTEEQTRSCSQLLQEFNFVSTRESSGVELCRQYLGTEAIQVVDPTMLLEKNDYVELFTATGTPMSKGNLLCYILDESKEKQDIIDYVAKTKGLNSFKVNSKVGDFSLPLEERIQPPVESWLRGFYDAEFVVTDSFHACVFSIIFQKPFIVIGNKERGLARFHSLLESFGLEDCMASDLESVKLTNIDWERVNSILQHKREEAITFLTNALK